MTMTEMPRKRLSKTGPKGTARMARAKGGGGKAVSPVKGDLDLIYAKDMKVLQHIQRRPTDSRLRSMAAEWDEAKVGIIQVARITDGAFVGTLHPYDGGTRVVSQQVYGDPNYVFICWVKDMTEKEAAEAFLACNNDSRPPSAYFRYTVALEAGHEWAQAIHDATARVGVTVAEHTTSTKISAVQACQRVVHSRLLASWQEAEDHLVDTLEVTMAAYPGSGEAYHNDLIQAVSRILLDNASIIDRSRLQAIIAVKNVGLWVAAAQAARGALAATSGGSESRSNTLRYELIGQYNKRLAAAKKLA